MLKLKKDELNEIDRAGAGGRLHEVYGVSPLLEPRRRRLGPGRAPLLKRWPSGLELGGRDRCDLRVLVLLLEPSAGNPLINFKVWGPSLTPTG
jgi:hypothetical protein